MSDTSRRGFLAIAGVGAAGAAIATAGVSSLGSAASSPSTKDPSPATGTELPQNATGSLVAYVTDVRKGQLSVLVGDREVVINDKEIVARLAQAAKTSEA